MIPVSVLTGPTVNMEVLKEGWILQEIGHEPKPPSKVHWHGKDRSLTPSEYKKYWSALKDYRKTRETKCTLENFVKFLQMNGFNVLTYKATCVHPIFVP
jgi:hypothetical protein